MAPNAWTDMAEKDLIWAFLKASNGGKIPKADWPRIHDIMKARGYNFTINALNQRWSKTIVKQYGDNTNTAGNAAASATASGLAASPVASKASRKRAAPGSGAQASGTRNNKGRQAAHGMAEDATSVNNSLDDDEPELKNVKPKAKRTKISHDGAAAGLTGQRIDLTDDGSDIQPALSVQGMAFPDQIKVEDQADLHGRSCRERSMTVAPVSASATYFNPATDHAGLSQERQLDDSI